MPVEYVNRKGHRYYLQSGKTRSGKPRYYSARKLAGTPVERVPDGYEIYESPEAGQVFLRRVALLACPAVGVDAGGILSFLELVKRGPLSE